MIDLRKKNFYFLIAAAIVLAVVIIAVPNSSEIKTSVFSENEPVIIIDPGHGGVDGGAVGVSGTVEKRINLEIALQLRDVLSAAGYNVIMTRDTDRSIHDSDAATISQMKVSDLHNRLAMTKMYDDSLLVSIHQNTLHDSSVTGAQVFYSPNNEESAVLAQCIQDQFNQHLQLAESREIKKAGKNLYLFYNAENAAILAECGFLSNSREEQLLCSQEHQKKIVFSLYCGILDFLNNREDVPDFG